jgi:hypothetical protein
MKEQIFWRLLGEITEMGDFIAAVPNGTASANIVGHLRPGRDGGEKVLEKEKCHCHIHLKPENVARFNFTYLDAGFGSEPCVEVLTHKNEAILKLYYCGGSVQRKFQNFTERNAGEAEFISGNW